MTSASTDYIFLVCHADVVVVLQALGDLLVVNGKYGVYAVMEGLSGEISDNHIADPSDISHAMQSGTRGFQAPSDDASCRALLLFSRPARAGTPSECAAPSQWVTSEKTQRCTLRYPVSTSLYS